MSFVIIGMEAKILQQKKKDLVIKNLQVKRKRNMKDKSNWNLALQELRSVYIVFPEYWDGSKNITTEEEGFGDKEPTGEESKEYEG